MTTSTASMELITAVETAIDKTKGGRGTTFLTALHEQGYRVEMMPPPGPVGEIITGVTLAPEPMRLAAE